MKLLAIILLIFSGCIIQTRHRYVYNIPAQKTKTCKTPRIIYTVKKGDSLWKIAKTYRISLKALCRVNKLSSAHKLKPGEKIIIPKNNILAGQWPLRGEAYPSHKGIDIKTNKSIIVYPFAAGRVDFAQNINGYGYTVIIKHNDGLSSIYSNLAKIYVKEGAWIRSDQPLGKVGEDVRTGKTFLHFEIRKNGCSVNPLLYLK